LQQGQTVILICDGTNVYNANTAQANVLSTLTLGNGSAAAPSLNFSGDTNSGFYLAATNQLGFSLANTNRMTLTTSGLLVPVGISGGTF
jgi:hypothetical protein